MKKYILNLFVVLIVVALIGWLVFSKIIPQYYLPVFPFLVLFFAVVSVSIHYYQLQLAKKDTAIFTRSIMLITFLKLILYSAVAIIYIAIDRENAKIFVVHFLSLYVIFIVFDVFSLLRITANSKKKG